mmetsp:Transcript_6535/g.9500  ORF Transcript_6535/g.9500 Transcript_6535/m.9500 type:complete len:133 (+) Transcript_6535:95-493(+)
MNSLILLFILSILCFHLLYVSSTTTTQTTSLVKNDLSLENQLLHHTRADDQEENLLFEKILFDEHPEELLDALDRKTISLIWVGVGSVALLALILLPCIIVPIVLIIRNRKEENKMLSDTLIDDMARDVISD